jgi:cation diffusion facilitator CzcD-associated flavoprotein CzcO
MMDPERDRAVIVIGAGPAGLAVSHELVSRGVDHVILERGAVGESWRRYYDSLVLHTGKHLSSLPGMSFGRSDPMFVTRRRFVGYLQAYATAMRLPVRAGLNVRRVARENGRWRLAATDGPWSCRVLVVATGIAASPSVPVLPGQSEFGGRISHSVAYRRPEPFAGSRVLVVGAGNSGGEIAAELARVAAPVSIAIRSGVVVVPRDILGIPTQYLGRLLRQLPRSIAEPVVEAITARRAARLPPSLPRSSASPLDEIPLIGMHLPDAISAGTVVVRPGVAGFTQRTVIFADGTEDAFDHVVMATGFHAALDPLGALVTRDARGFARRTDRVTSADQPDLYFVGQEYDASGGLSNIRQDAPVAADLVASAVAAWRGAGAVPAAS